MRNIENIENITKFCSKLSKIFRHPYFFNWSFPTNHRDYSPEGSMIDSTYFVFRVGVYKGASVTEKQLIFGPIFTITDFTIFNSILLENPNTLKRDEFPIKTFEDIEKYKDQLKKSFDDYLLK